LLGALDALQAQGRAALEAGRFGDAAGDLARVLELRSFEDPAHARVLHALCGSAALGQGDLDGARRHFVAALRPSPKDPDGFEPGALVAQICSAAMPGAAHFWALHDALQSFAAASEPAELRQELDSARRALDLNAVYRLGGDAGQALMPVVTPIAVEIGNLLVAQSGDPAGRLIDQYLPGMRERIHASMGVKLPGTRIRANGDDLPAELYVIMLDEVPIVSGSVQTRKRFAPVDEASLVAAGVPSDVLDEAALPGTSRQGCWVAEAGWDAVAEHGFELWPDPMLYMVHHLESLLRENLILFFGMQEARELVEQWSAAGDTGLAALTSKDVFRLSRLLRELVREGVPITRGPDIVDELRRADATGSSDLAAILATRPLEELLRVVRMRLRAFLPGNRAGDVRARLPPAIEARIAPFVQVDGSKHFLAMLPEETQALLTDIRELVESNPDVTLVTSSSLLRPMVRRLVSIEWPRMMVIASEELVDPEGGTHA
jgi:type III secretory pathway component EscV